MSGLLAQLKERARALKADTYALYLAYRDPRVPWYAKLVAACVVAYALSPIDLIPDFVPVLGYLDDLIIIPAGIRLALRLIPADVMAECRARAKVELERRGRPQNWAAAGLILLIWLAAALWAARCLWRLWRAE